MTTKPESAPEPAAQPAAPPEPQPPELGWLALVANLPTEDPSARMRMLRTLESLGAAVMREGVFLLPEAEGCRRGIESLAKYIVKGGGSAHVLHVSPGSESQQRFFKHLFDRSSRYEQLIKIIEGLRLGFGVSDPSAISRVLQKQRREFEAIGALDFFPNEMHQRAADALTEGEAEVKKLLFPEQPGAEAVRDEPLAGRAWVSKKPLWADRLACAWLIRRFVDPEATIAWVEKAAEMPEDAIGFAFDGARFANSAARVTFEEMLAQLELAKNPALVRIGAIVHFLEAGGTPVPEAAGVQTLLQGASRRAATNAELLREAEKTFDLLYDAYSELPSNS